MLWKCSWLQFGHINFVKQPKKLRINFYLLRTFCPHLGSFCVVSSFTTFRPNFTSGLLQVILPRPRIGMLSLVTLSPVITAFHSCCLLHHIFDQVNLWLDWVGFETAIFWQCSPGTIQTQRLYPLRHGPLRVSNPTQASQRFTWSKTWCDRQQLWKAVITGDTVTRLSIPIRGRGKITWRRPVVKFGWNVVKEETTQKLPRWGQKVRNK